MANDLISMSGNLEMGFYPLVQPEFDVPGEQASFEEFAYDYYYNVRRPPFPQDVATHNFGRGIWAQKTWRYRDSTGKTLRWDSPHRELFPKFQSSDDSELGRSTLMYNVHQDPSEGQPLDEVMQCSFGRKELQNIDKECGTVTHIFAPSRSSFLVQPIYPANDPFEVSRFKIGLLVMVTVTVNCLFVCLFCRL